LVTRVSAIVVIALCIVGGLASAAIVGIPAIALAVTGLLVGLLYDLRLKGTGLSGIPVAAGVATLPAYAWVGATGAWPPGLWAIIGLAVPTGLALSLANALVDLERDRLAGSNSTALALGRRAAWRFDAVLTAAVATAVGVSGTVLAGAAAVVLGPGLILQGIGVVLSRAEAPSRRERGWELQVAGGLALAGAWVWILVRAGALGG
jgi:4-hydroxybenzoate polyprenyltransferase